MKDTIIVIPEAWKFIPQKYNNPCKRAVESFIRQGATNNNFIFVDSQDMAGVDKTPLKQISTWILGYQSEINEVKHTLDEISLPNKSKPKPEDIMTLRIGHFFLSSYDGVKKVYVQPSWLDDEKAKLIAKGELDINTIEKPESLVPFSIVPTNREKMEIMFDDSKIRKELIELRQDIFDKFQEHQNYLQKLSEKVYSLESKKIDVDDITSKILQKIKFPELTSSFKINSDVDIPSEANLILGKLGGMARKIYEVLLQHKEGLTKAQIGLMSGYVYTSGSFHNALSKLRTMGLITKDEPIKTILK
jgi:hypothetical protein